MGQIYHNKFLAMNTRFHAIFPEMDDENADRIFSMVKQEVNRVENKLSRFIPDSDVSRVNKRAAAEPVKVDAELFEVFSACRFCWELTGGAFDLTLRPLMEHWKKNPGGTESGQDILQLKDSVGMDLVELDAEHQTVRFHHENVEADLGGFGKGYALEKVKNILGEASVQNAFVSFGESSILALGNHPAGDWWKVGMNDYLNPGKSLYEFKVSGGSVSTSSNFYVDNGGILKNHKHVINPATGLPVKECCSVSVSAESPVLAEMLSTAFLVSSDEKIKEVMNQYDHLEVIRINYENGDAEVTEFNVPETVPPAG